MTDNKLPNITTTAMEDDIASQPKDTLKSLQHRTIDFFEKFISQTVRQAKQIYHKASEVIEGERFIPISAESVNGLIGRYVVAKVDQVIALQADLGEQDFTLSGKIEAKGVKADIYAKFEVISFVFNDHIQRMIFKQIGQTQLSNIYYDSFITQIKATVGLWFLTKFKKTDLLGFILERKEIATVYRPSQNSSSQQANHDLGDEITFDLNRYFDPEGSVIKNLKRFHVSDACIKDGKLQLLSRINLDGFFSDETPDDTENEKLVVPVSSQNNTAT